MTVATVMSSNPIWISASESAADAARLMAAHGVRHLPVVQNAVLVGVVSINDFPPYVKPQLLVFDIMSAAPTCVQADAPIHLARQLIRENRIGCLPVLVGTRLVGIVTIQDLFA